MVNILQLKDILLLQNRNMPSIEGHNINWSHFWKFKLPRRILMFVWKFINRAIPTVDTLRRHHLNVNIDCVFCHPAEETMEHIFMYCPFVRAIWLGTQILNDYKSMGCQILHWLVKEWELGEQRVSLDFCYPW